MQHHLAAAGLHADDLELGGSARHDDDRPHAQLAGRQGQALGMVAGAGGDHPTGLLAGRKAGQLGIGAADLEGEHRLQVFALEQHLAAQPFGQRPRRLQRRLDGYVVDGGFEDLAGIALQESGGRFLGGHGGLLGCFVGAQESESTNPPLGRVWLRS